MAIEFRKAWRFAQANESGRLLPHMQYRTDDDDPGAFGEWQDVAAAPTSGGDDGTMAMRKAVRFMLEKKADTCKVQLFHDGKERNVELRILKVEDHE